MWGKFQSSQLRIEVKAKAEDLKNSLTKREKLSKWFFPLQIKSNLAGDSWQKGDRFTVSLGLVEVENQVELINENCLRLTLSKGIDGYQEWSWGDGWVQSRLEGISLLPLNLAQTFNLVRLREFVKPQDEKGENKSFANLLNNDEKD